MLGDVHGTAYNKCKDVLYHDIINFVKAFDDYDDSKYIIDLYVEIPKQPIKNKKDISSDSDY